MRFDPTYLYDLSQKLGIISKVKSLLLRQPDPAAQKLVAVLEELSKIYTEVDLELVSFLSLFFDASSVPKERAVLIKLEAGPLSVRVAEARGHCHKIYNIYEAYLNPWFRRVLPDQDAREIGGLFEELRNADVGFLRVLDELVQWLSPQATEVLALVDANRLDEANERIRSAHTETLPVRKAMRDGQTMLFELQAEFIELARIS